MNPLTQYQRNIGGVKAILRDFLFGALTGNAPTESVAYPDSRDQLTVQTLKSATLIILPVVDSLVELRGQTEARAIATFNIILRYRYPNELEYHQVGVARLERLQEALTIRALWQLGNYRHITKLEAAELDYPVNVARNESEQNDWVADVRLSFIVHYNIVDIDIPPEFGGIVPTEEVFNSLRIRTFESPIPAAVAGSVLDMDYLSLRP